MKTTTTETSIPEEKTTSARIQAYSKSQLAALYLPHIQPASARRTLRSWIAQNTELQATSRRVQLTLTTFTIPNHNHGSNLHHSGAEEKGLWQNTVGLV